MIIAVGNGFRCFLRSSCCAFHNFCLVRLFLCFYFLPLKTEIVRLRFSQVFINAVRFVNFVLARAVENQPCCLRRSIPLREMSAAVEPSQKPPGSSDTTPPTTFPRRASSKTNLAPIELPTASTPVRLFSPKNSVTASDKDAIVVAPFKAGVSPCPDKDKYATELAFRRNRTRHCQ